MKSRLWVGLTVVTAIFAASFTAAQEGEAPAVVGHYVGVKITKKCHSGAARVPSSSSGRSRSARRSSCSRARRLSRSRLPKGIKDPQKAKECLECHVTGHGADASMFRSDVLGLRRCRL